MIGLFAAVECGDPKKVEQLLNQLKQDAKNEDVSKMLDYRERTPLHLAVELGNEEMVDVLLGHGGINLRVKDCADFTALHLACELGHDKIVARLLAKNAGLIREKAQKHELSCLHLAAIRGKTKVVKLLLEMSPDLVTKEDKLERPPLHFAVEHGHEEIVEMLVESAKSNTGYGEATFHAAIRSGHDKIVSRLLDHRPQLIDVVEKHGRSPLHLAAACHRRSIVELLFTRRQPRLAEVGGNYDMSLLHFAAQYGFDAIVVELLVEQPHLIDLAAGHHSMTALHLAVENGHEKIAEQLLAQKPLLIDTKDRHGRTTLHLATLGGHLKVMEWLLALKPDLIDIQDRQGKTALSEACSKVRPELVTCLLAHEPAVFTKEMVWGVVEQYGWRTDRAPEVLKLILSRKPELAGSLDHCKNTLLHRVFGFVYEENFYKDDDDNNDYEDELFGEEVMLLVLQLGPPDLLHVTNVFEQTPFKIAINSDNTDAIELAQWKLSLDELMSAYGSRHFFLKHSDSLLDQIRDALLLSLDRDVVGTVWEYLGFERPQHKTEDGKANNSKKRKMEEQETE